MLDNRRTAAWHVDNDFKKGGEKPHIRHTVIFPVFSPFLLYMSLFTFIFPATSACVGLPIHVCVMKV